MHSNHVGALYLSSQLVQLHVWGHEDLAVLLHKLCEVGEQWMLLAKEVKLIVPLLTDHQFVEELSSIASHKLSSQLYNVPGSKRSIQTLILRYTTMYIMCGRVGIHRLWNMHIEIYVYTTLAYIQVRREERQLIQAMNMHIHVPVH